MKPPRSLDLSRSRGTSRIGRDLLFACAALTVMAVAFAEAMDDGHLHGTAGAKPPAFEATRAKPFAALMGDAMNVMNDGMSRAPMNGAADHDFRPDDALLGPAVWAAHGAEGVERNDGPDTG